MATAVKTETKDKSQAKESANQAVATKAPAGDASLIAKAARRFNEMVERGQLEPPADYSVANALQAAWVRLLQLETRDKKPALEVVTQASIYQALMLMVVLGLDPSKDQCYFVPYGKSLVMLPSAFGKVRMLKHAVGEDAEVWAQVVYEADDFEYEIDTAGRGIRVTKHVQRLSNIDGSKIVAAYAVATWEGGQRQRTELMTIKEIEAAWSMGEAKGSSPAHQKFRSEMAKKTAISRACKMLIRSSSNAGMRKLLAAQEAVVGEARIEEAMEIDANRDLLTFDGPAALTTGSGAHTIDVQSSPSAAETVSSADLDAAADAIVEDVLSGKVRSGASKIEATAFTDADARFWALADKYDLKHETARQAAGILAGVRDPSEVSRRWPQVVIVAMEHDAQEILRAYEAANSGGANRGF